MKQAGRARSSPDGLATEEPVHLLLAEIANQCCIVDSWNLLPVTRHETVKDPCRADDVRLLQKPDRALRQHEERMVPAHVVGAPVLDQAPPRAPGGAGGTMMQDERIAKASRAPAEHIGLHFIERI